MLLGDIWRKVDLEEEIGIPLPSPENGSKVVFTTRSKKVCGRMGRHDVEVKHLDPKNAWELFRQKVRGTKLDSEPKILELAKKICEKCKGLPLALKVIGETMACKTSVREWQCAIDDLNTNAADYPEVKDKILTILKLSYDILKDEIVKQCFQYCALFLEDEEIDEEELIEYWRHEGIINGGGDRERAINHGYRIIGILISACLLMPVETSEFLAIHDVLRQMALWVASNFGKEEEKFIVKTGAGLHQMPEVRDWNSVRRMSLAKNEIQNISGSPELEVNGGIIVSVVKEEDWFKKHRSRVKVIDYGEAVIMPGLVDAKYILEQEDNLEALQEVAPRLKAVKDDLQKKIEMEERRGLRALDEFNVWLSEVEAIQPKVTKLLEDRTSEIERLSMCGMGPPPGIEERTTQRTVGLEKMLETTWSLLMEKEVGILGIYVVSQNIQVGKIQKKIGERLGLCDVEWEKKDQNEKATCIKDVLTRKRFVMLLDDIWRKVDLEEEIGIPLPSPEMEARLSLPLARKKFVGVLDAMTWKSSI
ncbi:hypothetical protein F2Q69_00060545 [Brassica cretica]|uniref:NB-ARC domain-containing protein n=1 Tax=Brassica cretica TaxID=69181 RepID=A0A8S9RGG8_BRACR|nr:hypothetical protein F2Q69_00060545 [Brassica cretica]